MTLNCKGKIINFNTQRIMGILNISDDSFYDGGKYNSIDKAVSRVSEMINQGVDIIDVGAVSSKPGSKIIEGEDELKLTSQLTPLSEGKQMQMRLVHPFVLTKKR